MKDSFEARGMLAEKIDYLLEPVKFINTGRFRVVLRELAGLLSSLPFLTMAKYYKKVISLLNFRAGKKTLKLKSVPTINLPIKSHR